MTKTADDRQTIDQLSIDVRPHLEGWTTTTTTQANGYPMVVLTSPEGSEYHAGRRWGNRAEDRVTVWPANVDHDCLPWQGSSRAQIPEATFRVDRGGKALAQTLRRVERSWEPTRAKMLKRRAEAQAYANAKQGTRERLLEAMGEQARPTDEGASLYLDGVRIDARASNDSIRLEWMSLPTELALKVIKLVRSELGE